MNETCPETGPKGSWLMRAFRRVTAGGWILLAFTVVLPALVLAVELTTRICTELFLDPVPDGWNLAAVAAVPIAYLFAWLSARHPAPRRTWPAAFLAGLAQGLSAYYALLMLPIALLGGLVLVMGWWYFGFGLIGILPLAPALAFLGGYFMRRRLLRATLGAPRGRLRGMGFGWLAAMLVVLALLASGVATSIGLHLMTRDDAAQQARGLHLLRRSGRHDLLMRACEWNREASFIGLQRLLLPSRDQLSIEEAQRLFYRVTGEDYALARARIGGRRPNLGRGFAEVFEWDNDQGGARVGGLLKGLSLYGSRYEARADAAAGLAYAEWTLVFRNAHVSEREARARIALPPGAVVSRLTLWIDGEEREAAFGGRSQVRQAYERVVSRRRDPVLVGTCGPDRIQVQCYPVPPNGGEMKIRLGITAPLAIDADGASGRLDAPAIVERNFRLRHDAVDLPQPLVLNLDPPLAEHAWARDTRFEPPAIVQQHAVRVPAWRPSRVAVVVDTSLAMRPSVATVAESLAALPAGVELRLWAVGDAATPEPPITATTPLDATTQARIRKVLSSSACVGGRCSLRTLQAAWDDLGDDGTSAALVWIHGPQPFPSQTADDLCRRLERASPDKRLYAFQTVAGACRITEALDGVRGVQTLVPADALADVKAPLRRLLDGWTGETEIWQCVRTRVPGEAVGEGREAGEHLVRQWAADEVRRKLVSGDAVRRDEARQLALAWHLVTPVTSAVVLENQQQYREAGLEPVQASTVPTVPEPGLWVTLLLAAVVLVGWRWRERRAIRGA
ncbi:MAG: hypothetical protein GX590_11745 [Lentisphaerae bacterium]|nr:hypothetical protein [Lentisphaerota bacterium]